MAKDKDYKKLIAKNRWQKLRKAQLSKHPLCERCKEDGKLVPATEVHHVTPVEDGLTATDKAALMYNPSNLISLCHDCHVKTHTEMGRGGKAGARNRAKRQIAGFVKKFLIFTIFCTNVNAGYCFLTEGVQGKPRPNLFPCVSCFLNVFGGMGINGF